MEKTWTRIVHERGGSLDVTIPAQLAYELGMRASGRVHLTKSGDGILLRTSLD